MDVELLYKVPGFVKEAGEAALDPSVPGAVVVGGFRLDSPAAAWYASASLRKEAMENPNDIRGGYLAKMVKEACELFGVGEDSFQFCDSSNYETVLIKEANHSAEFIIGTQGDFEEAVRGLFSKRASAPYDFCRKCASALCDIGNRNGYELESDSYDLLHKMAGEGNVDFSRGAEACRQRENYARARGLHREADILSKFASVCDTTTDERIVPLVISGLDEFDRGVKCINKYASENIKFPESSFYQSAEESIKALANTDMAIDSTHSIKRRELMNEDKLNKIASWSADSGYVLPMFPTPEEIVTTVKTMPDSLREEFIENFA